MEQKFKLNILLIGYGYWGKNLARVISQNPNCKLLAISDLNKDNLKIASTKHPNVYLYEDYIASLNQDDINAVVIATPVEKQFEISKKCIAYNKHILCEKVLSLNRVDHNFIIRQVKKKELIFNVGYTFLYNDIVRDIKRKISDNFFGKIYYINCRRLGLGPRRSDVNAIEDLIPHDLSILISWFGMPEWVSCNNISIIHKNKSDVGFILLGYKSNFIANIQVSWIHPIKERKIEIIGEKCMLVFDDVALSDKLKIFYTGSDYHSKIKDFASFQLSIKDGDILIPNIDYTEPLVNEVDFFVQNVKTHNLENSSLKLGKDIIKVLSALRFSIDNDGIKVAI